MKKGNLVATIMGTVGGILLALGMVFTLVESFNAFIPGIVAGSIGLLVLAMIYPIYRKVESLGFTKPSRQNVIAAIIGIIGTIALGVGLCLCLLNEGGALMIVGIIIGLLGIAAVSLNYPIYKFRKSK